MNTARLNVLLVSVSYLLVFHVKIVTLEVEDIQSPNSNFSSDSTKLDLFIYNSLLQARINNLVEANGNINKPKKRQPSALESFIASEGYRLEHHTIVTEDEYVLTYHRLRLKDTDAKIKKGLILLQHGFLSASVAFMTRKGSSLAFALVDEGFDVWMGNARGNTFSRKHRQLNPDIDDVYWEFSFHEMGKYDLPAGIDYILDNTNSSSLIYVGFSMGTTMFFVMGATRPEYMSKVEVMVAVAPICRPMNMVLAKRFVLFTLVRNLMNMLLYFGFDEMFPHTEKPFRYIEVLCTPHQTPSTICLWLLSILIRGESHHHDRANSIRKLLYFPAGTSVRTTDHLLQIANSGIFRQYDQGRWGNWRRYGRLTPPEYDLKNLKGKLYFIWSENDTLSAKDDVEWLMNELPERPLSIKASVEDFSHNDFLHGKFSTDILHNDIITNIFYAAKHGDDETSVTNAFGDIKHDPRKE